jgi:hypothetical protein
MIAIEFFDKSEITVYFNNIPTTAFTWATDKSLHFNSVVPVGIEVLVRRTTDLSGVRHVFSAGAQFKDATLDDDFRQILHIAQEAVEGANVGDIYSTLNMHGNKIANVGPATLDGDAISLGQVKTESQGAYLANTQAQAAATAAAVSRDVATAQAVIATNAQGVAVTQAASATASASTATTQAGLSSTARAGAEAAQAAAAASQAMAQKWAAEVEDTVVSGGLYSSFHYSRKSSASATASAASAAQAASLAASFNLPSMAGKAGQGLRANAAETGYEYVPFTGTAFIEGLLPVWGVGGTSVSVTPGSAYVPGIGRNITVASTLTLSSLSLTINTWYYLYLYLNSGVPSIELSSTVPLDPYCGSARTKTGDTSRRFVAALKSAPDGTLFAFQWMNTGYIQYCTVLNGAPFRCVTGGTATTATTVALGGVVPPTTRAVSFITTISTATGFCDLWLTTPDFIGRVLRYCGNVLSSATAGTRTSVEMMTDSQQRVSYLFSTVGTGSSLFLDVYGYGSDR